MVKRNRKAEKNTQQGITIVVQYVTILSELSHFPNLETITAIFEQFDHTLMTEVELGEDTNRGDPWAIYESISIPLDTLEESGHLLTEYITICRDGECIQLKVNQIPILLGKEYSVFTEQSGDGFCTYGRAYLMVS